MSRRRVVAEGLTLPAAVQAFREAGGAALPAPEATADLWSAACDLVDALLLGVHAHFPEAVDRIELGRPSQPSIRVHFRHALKGEFATRSRLGAELHIGSDICFALRPSLLPSQEDLARGASPLRLHVSGLVMRPLPECAKMRVDLISLLGEENYTRESVYRWWEDHMDEFRPEKSKMRRIYESFLGLKAAPLPRWAREKGMWGYINALPEVYETFEVQHDARAPGGVTLTATLRPPTTPEEERGHARLRSFCQEVITKDRTAGTRLAASSINYVAMVHGHSAGCHGACPRKITKLFSAAKSWGPGKDSWQRYDDTWLCTDSKDMLGRIISEQGRLVWRRLQNDRWLSHVDTADQALWAEKLHEAPTQCRSYERKPTPARISFVLIFGLFIAFTMRSVLPEQLLLMSA